jgi:hypothetical protein
VTLYDLLRKLVNGERMWENDKADANSLIDKLEQLNAFGSTALYVGEHECVPGLPKNIYDTPNWITGRGWETRPITTFRTVANCTICGREM